MIGIQARRIIALVANELALWDWPYEHLEGSAVSPNILAVPVRLPIAVFVAALLPDPTVAIIRFAVVLQSAGNVAKLRGH